MSEQKGLVSIILNCFNGEKYLRKAIDSVINQKYKNWELVFWDNRSTDKSKKIIETFNSKKIKYYFTNKHSSLYEARNLALEKCNGEYVAFIDADDTWEPDKLEDQIKLFDNKKVGVVYGNLWIYNEKLKKRKIFSKKNLIEGKIYQKIFSNYKIGIISSIIKRDILTLNNLRFESQYNHIGDFDLFIKLSKICEFNAIQKPVATYRVHGDNLSLKDTDKEIIELKHWFKKNQFNLNKDQEHHLLIRISSREFINIRFKKNLFEAIKFFFKKKYLMKNIKNYFLLFIPVYILKKIMWYQ